MSKYPDIPLEKYQDAVWDFMLEHCDVTDRGAFFIKFHASNRADLEKRIRARAIHGYHRIDTRTKETHKQKERRATKLKAAARNKKRAKREVWKADAEERRRVFAELNRKNEWQRRYKRLYPVLEWCYQLYTTLTRKYMNYERRK